MEYHTPSNEQSHCSSVIHHSTVGIGGGASLKLGTGMLIDEHRKQDYRGADGWGLGRGVPSPMRRVLGRGLCPLQRRF